MLLFGIFGLLLVGSIVAIILGEKRYAEELETCGWIMGILTLIVLIICVCVLPWKRDVQYELMNKNKNFL